MFSSSFIFKAFCCSINISHSVIFRKNECWVFYLLDAVLHLYKILISSVTPFWIPQSLGNWKTISYYKRLIFKTRLRFERLWFVNSKRIESTMHACYWWFIGPLTYIGSNIWSCKYYETHCTNLTGCDENEKGKKNETEKELTTLNNTKTSPPRSDRRLTT